MHKVYPTTAVIGAGAMGRGIAQMAAQTGSTVLVFDRQPGAAEQAVEAIRAQWDRMARKGHLTAEAAADHAGRLSMAESLHALSSTTLVVEAIVEQLDAKRQLFTALEDIVPTTTVLATNTSSLSVTAIAAPLRHPERCAGLHFFNPVPLMKVVEVIAGLRTAPAICDALQAYVAQMGHTAVHAQDTPGFIVNHAGRGYGTEALRILGENITDVATIDRILRDQVGFRLGPFELMDLTGLDISHPVMESIYHQYHQEPRYRPSAITAQRLAGNMLGRKTGEGFYRYADGKADLPAEPPVPVVETVPPVWVSPRAARRAELLQSLRDLGATVETGAAPSSNALTIVAPLGFDITTVAVVERLDPARTVGIDLLFADAATRRRVLAVNPATRRDMRDAAHALFARDGKPVSVVRDSGGFVTQRVVATIVNIASDMCQQGVCTPQDLDTAVTLGLGYPTGPLALGNLLGPTNVLEVLFNLQTVYGDPRYRPSPWLRRRGAIGLSLLHTED
ncbi:3-hydroxyacyl-CoA dehydrogenase [Xylophilus ampelinus]|uniref:3-hydroxybutyryl-CoA dehydrogenase n=1 Tax=Xylophilus ampelinus TaxID=54067 RepID=A0A318SQS5_9BURK|nr:3-hydroxyacyl-CoA dehydrogenase [Xylophilus ampelinus]MCS4508859.1 3-hydroxyacyl-CoA dehydrogenase [Xylophilus ampelinus]PYE79430.1 3-hydroxybutyryl-CoA dehydrogenase [Xylophilus ampelinus]